MKIHFDETEEYEKRNRQDRDQDHDQDHDQGHDRITIRVILW